VIDNALRGAYTKALGFDILDPNGQCPGERDPTFLRDLAGLKAKAGGCGYRSTERRAAFLSTPSSTFPQVIGDGKAPWLWPSLATALGADSFKEGNEAAIWETFFTFDSAWAQELESENERVNPSAKTPSEQKDAATILQHTTISTYPPRGSELGSKSCNADSSTILGVMKPLPLPAEPQRFDPTTNESSRSNRAAHAVSRTCSSQPRHAKPVLQPALKLHQQTASSTPPFGMPSEPHWAYSITPSGCLLSQLPVTDRPQKSIRLAETSKNLGQRLEEEHCGITTRSWIFCRSGWHGPL
jgi:hypothetical protein